MRDVLKTSFDLYSVNPAFKRVTRSNGLSVISFLFLFTSCSFAPEYHTPQLPQPAAYKESRDWKPAAPADSQPRGKWWEIFGSTELDSLEDKASNANQDIKVMAARYQEARALSSFARADYFPTLQANANPSRNGASSTAANARPTTVYNDYSVAGDFSYELDLWGRVRNNVTAADSQAEAARADLATANLSVNAELAVDYFALRADDSAQKVLDDTVNSYSEAYQLTQSRFKGGVSAQIDVDQAQAQLENARTQSTDMRLKRAQLEHAIAVLTGEVPSLFSLPPALLTVVVPEISVNVPSELLERRPDVAAAERRVKAANATIGVARAAWFPRINLLGSFGVESSSTGNLFSVPSQIWTLGPSIVFGGLDAGRVAALSAQARAAYDEAAASYRSVALNAYAQVEDSLIALKQLQQENTSQTAATQASERALTQAQDRYKGGIVNYFDVVTAQNAALQARLASVDIKARQLTASVLLVKALGGGWKVEDNKVK